MDMIFCKQCKENKNREDFYKGKLTKCKECVKTDAKNSYYKSGGIETLRKWREENPELFKEQRERQKERRRELRRTDSEYRDRINEYKRENSRKNFKSGLIGRAKRRATIKGLEFSITTEDLVIPEKCPILEVLLVLGRKHNYSYSPSLDRIDPKKGYTKENTRVISSLANTMKNSATFEELKTFAKNIESYLMI